MNNNTTTQTNPPEEIPNLEQVEEKVDYLLKFTNEHVKELENCTDTKFIGVTPSKRLILKASELIIDRHNKEFNSILKELVETFNNDEEV